MTEPSPAGPSPGRPRPGPVPVAPRADEVPPPAADEHPRRTPFEDLEQRPVSEHVGVFEAEHARLQRELGTIDQV